MMTREEVRKRVGELLDGSATVSFPPNSTGGVDVRIEIVGTLVSYREDRKPGEFEQELEAMCDWLAGRRNWADVSDSVEERKGKR